MKKRFLSILLSLLMVAMLLPMNLRVASADASGSCGASISWTFDSATGTLTLTGSRAMYGYTKNTQPWSAFRTEIRTVIISNYITSIGSSAFEGCTALTSVTIPNSVTGIGNDAFNNCISLTEIALPTNLASYGLGSRVFYNCFRLTEITIPDRVSSIPAYGFSGCSSLSSVTIGECVTEIQQFAFERCGLTEITLPDSLQYISGSAFADCWYLTEVIIPAQVYFFGLGAFMNCRSLTSYTVEEGNEWYEAVDGVLFTKDMTQLVAYPLGHSRTAYEIPDSVTTVASAAFYGCRKLEQITLPGSVMSIPDNAFRCSPDQSVYPLRDVWYQGTRQMRDRITIGSYNTGLTDATWHYLEPLSIEMKTLPDKCVYCIDEELDLTGGTIKVSYENDITEEEIITAEMVSGYQPAVTGAQTLAVSFGSLTTTFDVTVNPHVPGDPERDEAAPTCTEEGYTDEVVHCVACGVELSRQHTAIPATGHTPGEPVHENEAAPTCTEEGHYDEVVYCTVCEAELSREQEPIPATGHTPGEPVRENEVASTCTEEGHYDEVVYCTVCEAELNREQKPIPAHGHTSGEPVRENEVAPTCTEEGHYDEVVYCTVCEAELSREQKPIPAAGHTWGEPFYVWADDNSSVTATRVCGADSTHIETETVSTTSEITVPPTYTEMGTTTYTATFVNPAFETQIKDVVDIPVLSFEGVIEWNAEDVQFKGATAYVIDDGSAQTPRFTVKSQEDGSTIDPAYYDFEYLENTRAGTAYVVVTFKNGPAGTCRGSFKIYLPATAATTVENTRQGIQLTWEPVEGAAGYVIYRRAWSTTTNGWTAFARWDNTTDTTYLDGHDDAHKVYAGTRYQYGVKAYFTRRTDPISGEEIGGNVNNPSGNYNLGEVGPLKTTVRITTRNLTKATGEVEKVTLKWEGSSLFTGYELQISSNSSFTQIVKTVKVADPKTVQKVVTGLPATDFLGTSLYARVRSYHVFNGMTYYGGWSNHMVFTSKPQYRAVIVGETDYSGIGASSLPGCYNDACAVWGMLTGLTKPYVTSQKTDATKSWIMTNISKMAAGSTADSVSVFYFSGHGLMAQNADGSYDGTKHGALVTIDGQYITFSALASELSRINGRVIVILDSCHSGASIGKGLNEDDVLSAFNRDAIEAFSGYDLETGEKSINPKSGELKKSKFTVLTAASYKQSSWDGRYDGSGYAQGAFTAALIKGMGCKYKWGEYAGSMPADKNKDKKVTLKELYDYTYSTAKYWTRNTGAPQYVQYYGTDGSVVFGR